MDAEAVTRRYYARWFGVWPDELLRPGLRFVYHPARNRVPPGYPRALDVLTLVRGETLLVAYGDRALPGVATLRGRLAAGMGAGAVADALAAVFGVTPERNLKFRYAVPLPAEGAAGPLTAGDLPAYEAFFAACHPGCADASWVGPYFLEMTGRGRCYGAWADGWLVSVADAPDMPCLAEEVQEIGIHTLPAWRGRGYARRVCLAAAGDLVRRGVCPQWSTTPDNAASQRLARAVGFVPYFEQASVSL